MSPLVPDRPTVRTGLDRLVADPSLIGAGRVSLVTNFTGVTADLRRGVDRLLSRGVGVTVLLGPEHGLRGTAQAGESEGEAVDPATGLPVVDTYLMPADVLDQRIRESGVDALVFDMQDVGTRYWTYTSTMYDCMASAARCGIGFVVLDRPNPLGGRAVEGPGLEPGLRSFVGRVDVPLRHGLTSGELARLIARVAPETGVPMPPVEVVAVEGWEDRGPARTTGLPWVPPSPNLPTADTALVYPATGLIEGVNVSEGRGPPGRSRRSARLSSTGSSRPCWTSRSSPGWCSATPGSGRCSTSTPGRRSAGSPCTSPTRRASSRCGPA